MFMPRVYVCVDINSVPVKVYLFPLRECSVYHPTFLDSHTDLSTPQEATATTGAGRKE